MCHHWQLKHDRPCSSAAEATPEVLDSDDAPLPALHFYPPNLSEPEEDSSAANDAVVNSAGMQSMSTSNVTAEHAEAVCKNNTFLLPLQLGQNRFSVAITAPDPPEQASIHNKTFDSVYQSAITNIVYIQS